MVQKVTAGLDANQISMYATLVVVLSLVLLLPEGGNNKKNKSGKDFFSFSALKSLLQQQPAADWLKLHG